MKLNDTILNYIETHQEEHMQLLLALAQIPAPSNHEEERALFCKKWLAQNGAEGVYIDEALNVIYPVGVTKDNALMVYAAHSDVVFPDTEPLPLKIEGGKIFCPGIGDDTASVAALMLASKYIAQNHLHPKNGGLLLVINAGEEGLGNLKGTRKLFETYGRRICEFISFDGRCCHCVDEAVGSRRYRIEVDTEGGHSYGSFGNRNAIAYLASLIDTLYTIKVPSEGKTTYNVGTISGGTSVNTIAQHAEMLYEFRSDVRQSLAVMEAHLEAAIAFYRTKGIRITVTLVGDRPCSGPVEPEEMARLRARAEEANRRHYATELAFGSGSTDCNIPLTLGVPSICVGCYDGAGAHTREEYVLIDSLLPGLRFAFDLILHHF